MSPVFGKGKSKVEKTVLLVDIESGSVGCALARLSVGQARTGSSSGPKLFAEARVALPIFSTLDTGVLLRETEKTLREMLAHASLVAARMRGHEQVASMGVVSEALVFLSPPWTSPTPQGPSSKPIPKGTPLDVMQWKHEPVLAARASAAIKDLFGDIPVSYHALGGAALHTANMLFQDQNDYLLFVVGGEVAELLLPRGDGLAGHATLPFGQHAVLRTLQRHAGLSEHEARSALRLSVGRGGMPSAFAEPLGAAVAHLEKEFGDAAYEVLGEHIVHGILVIAPEPAGEWFARALSWAGPLAEIFPQGATVRALHTRHLEPHFAAHAAAPDLYLMLALLSAARG